MLEAYGQWMARLNTRVDVTLKYRAKFSSPNWPGGFFWLSASDDTIRKTLTRAMNRLNGYVVKPPRSRRRDPRDGVKTPRLDALFWLEWGGASGRPHVHGLVERPAFCQPEAFAKAVHKAFRAQHFVYRQMMVEEVRDLESSLRYNAKTATRRDGGLKDSSYWHHEGDETAWWRADWLREWNG